MDALLRLQGPGLWPFSGQAQDALLTALASVMTAIPKSAISVVATAQVCPFLPYIMDIAVLFPAMMLVFTSLLGFQSGQLL